MVDKTKEIKDFETKENERKEKEREEKLNLLQTVKELMKINKIPRFLFKDLIITGKVGEGGQAKVYIAKYKENNVAVKILENVDHKCIAHEIVIVSNLKHKNIPKFYGILLDEEKFGFVTEFVSGQSMDKLDFPNFQENIKLKIICDLVEVLDYLHSNTFVHRDLKPENIMIDEKFNLNLIDFGISKVLTNTIDTVTRAKGTIYYIAPETLEASELSENQEIISKICSKVDTWALGCIASYMFSGITPWENKTKNASQIQTLLIKKNKFPIPEDKILERSYNNLDIILELIKQCTEIDYQIRYSMKDIKEKILPKFNLK